MKELNNFLYIYTQIHSTMKRLIAKRVKKQSQWNGRCGFTLFLYAI